MARPEVFQVQFRPDEADRIKASAEQLGVSHSAYIRRLVMSKVLVPTWWVPPFDSPEMKVVAMRNTGAHKMHTTDPDYFLELLYETQDGGAAYKVFGRRMAPMTFEHLKVQDLVLRELARGRVMMDGSHALWQVVRSVADANLGGQLIWLLGADRRDDWDSLNPPEQKGSVNA